MAEVTLCGFSKRVDTLVFDPFDEFNDALEAGVDEQSPTYYRLHGLSRSQVAEHVTSVLRVAGEMNPEVFADGGVGGRWTFALVTPTKPPVVTTADIGR